MSEDKNKQGQPQVEKEFDRFDYGDLALTCSNCGEVEVVEKGIKDGLQFILPTTSEHKVKLACGKCGVSLTLAFTESDEETKKEAEDRFKQWQEEQEAAKAKAEDTMEKAEEKLDELAKEEDALLQENKEEESA